MKEKLLMLVVMILVILKTNAQCTGNVTIPDANFKNALITLGIDTDSNNVISCVEAAAFTGDLDVRNLDIADLTGLEAFVNITELDCSLNDLTSLDVSNNTALVTLSCGSNYGLTSLDVSNNVALEDLSTLYTSITSLDLSTNVALTDLQCSHNDLTSLDVSNNTALTYLSCHNNEISNLNVTGATALETLNSYSNPLKDLDVSTNTALVYLTCNDNELTSLDVSNNLALDRVTCYDNSITYLDVSANPVLTRVSASNNNLIGLNIANGNNINFSSSNNFTNNPNLGCIQVDDVTYANTNMTGFKDATASYGAICYVTIPDAIFKSALVGNTSINTNSDSEISFQEAISYSGSISVSTQGINSLVGVEAFSNINSLNCSYNNLTSLDVSSNTKLTYIGCHNNNLTTIDVSNNLVLTSLRCDSNQLTNIDVSGNPVLTSLRCRSNNLIGVSVANGNNTNFGTSTSSLDLRYNSNLTCIEVDDVAYANANWASLKDATASYNIICIVNIPDVNFKSDLVNNTAINTNGDAEISYAEAAGFKGELNIQYGGIADLTGLEAFVNLTSLDCGDNDITTLDVTANTALKVLDCSRNDITTINVATNTQLTYLNCAYNNLTSLDVATNIALTDLYCGTNDITSLDVATNTALVNLNFSSNTITSIDLSSNTALAYLITNSNPLNNLDVSTNISLETLRCSSNSLTSLDVSTNTALIDLSCGSNSLTNLDLSNNLSLEDLSCTYNSLTSLDVAANTLLTSVLCSSNDLVNLNVANGNNTNFSLSFGSINFSNNPNLLCIKVDDVAYSETNWASYKDATTSFSATGIIDVPDTNLKNSLLNDHTIDVNNDGEISCGEASSYVGVLNLSSKSISDLTGLENFINVTQLFCNDNAITTIDITALTNLTDLSCNNNNLTDLNFSSNTALTYLSCNNNNLTSLDISGNNSITYFSCSDNNLVSLNLATSNYANLFVNTAFPNFINNPNLVCIKVYSVTYADANWGALKDDTATYSDTGNVVIPDANFKNSLLNNHTIDLDNDGEISCGEASVYSGTIDVSNQSVADITGIESFINSTELLVNNNSISSIDVSLLTALTNLSLNDNMLTSLNVDENLALTTLSLDNNTITDLNVTNNINLVSLSCANNQLTHLDVASNTALTNLDCNNNEIIDLDISTNTVLTTLYCYDNALTGLNLANGNNTNMLADTTNPNYAGNPNLTCIQVDDESFANGSNWIIVKDATASYSNSCDYSRVLTITVTNGAIAASIASVGGTYENATLVELTATPDTGYQFDGWSGDATGTDNPLSITMNADKSVTAMFSEIATASVDDVFAKTVSIYPNPTAANLTVSLKDPLKHIEVFTISGRKVHTTTNTKVDLSSFSSGVYLVKVTTEDYKTAIKRIIKK